MEEADTITGEEGVLTEWRGRAVQLDSINTRAESACGFRA